MRGRLRYGLFGVALAFVLAGCYPFSSWVGDPITGCDGSIGAETPFTHLTATVTLTGGESQRATLGPSIDGMPSSSNAGCPSFAHGAWSDPKGKLMLTIDTIGALGGLDALGNPTSGERVAVTLLRGDHEPPLVFVDVPAAGGTPSCTVTLTDNSPTGLVGHAECPGVRWSSQYDDDPISTPLPGLPAFNASIDFSALP